jgi:hypothetical protein
MCYIQSRSARILQKLKGAPFERMKNTDFINGYALFKLLIGLGLWHIAIEQLESGSWFGTLIPGSVAICFVMEAIRLLREKYRSK